MNAFSASSRHSTVQETCVLCTFPAPHFICTVQSATGVDRFLMTPQIANAVCLLAPDHMIVQYYAIQSQCSTCTTFKIKGLKIASYLTTQECRACSCVIPGVIWHFGRVDVGDFYYSVNRT